MTISVLSDIPDGCDLVCAPDSRQINCWYRYQSVGVPSPYTMETTQKICYTRTTVTRRRIGVQLLVTASIAIALTGLTTTSAQAAACGGGQPNDYNGDGYSDAAVADPSASVSGHAQAGHVIILYGDADSRVGEGARNTVRQGSGTVSGAAETGDRFGSALASADIDWDGCHDLIVGTPYEDIGTTTNAGTAQIIWGDPEGLGAGRPSRQLYRSTFGQPNLPGDQFGYAVDALDNVTQGGTPEPDSFALGIGAPGVDVAGHDDAGWVGFLAATDGGNVAMDATQNTPGVPGAAEAHDRFGSAISINYLTGRLDTVDAAIGVPGEDIGSDVDAGMVTVLREVYDEITDGTNLHQDSSGVSGATESGDKFGRSLDTVRVGTTSRLAVGVPGEDIGRTANAGMVHLFDGDGSTPLSHVAGLHQNSAGVSGTAEAGDLFGDELTFAAPGPGNSRTRLAVSAASEDSSHTNTGAVWIFPLDNLTAETVYTQGSPGMPGGVDAGDRFGSTLAVVHGVHEVVLIIGVPDDVDHSTGLVNILPFGGAAKRFWAPGSSGVPTSGASRFGDAVASSAD